MSAATSLALTLEEQGAPTERPKALTVPYVAPVAFALPLFGDDRDALESMVRAWENEEAKLPIAELAHAERFTPCRAARQANACGAPDFAVQVGSLVVGAWRGLGGWMVGVAEGEVECDVCRADVHTDDIDQQRDGFVCHLCSDTFHRMDDR